MLALAVAVYNKGQKEGAVKMAKTALGLDKQFAELDHLEKNLWGKRLIADTKKFLALPEIQEFISSKGVK